jgi:hypothetical protein
MAHSSIEVPGANSARIKRTAKQRHSYEHKRKEDLRNQGLTMDPKEKSDQAKRREERQ